MLLFTEAKIKQWRTSLAGRRKKQEHLSDLNTQPNELSSFQAKSFPDKFKGSVAAARKVSPNWSLQTMTCHSSHCFSIV